MSRLFLIAVLALALSGCGSGSGPLTEAPSAPSTGTGGNGGSGSGTTPVSAPTLVTVAGGATASGVNITVSGPVSTTVPNAESLGVSFTTGSGSASNTGATISRGATGRVLLFGAGLSGEMQVLIGGPADVTVSNVTTISSTSGTPGISFDINVSLQAALGARTVYLKAPNNDITAFAGGLEIVR